MGDKSGRWASDRERLEAVGTAAAEGLHCLSLAAGGCSARVAGAYCWYSSSFVPAFNGASLFTDDLFSPSNLSTLDAYFRERKRPYSFVTMDGLADSGRKNLYARGYYEFDSSPAMLLEGDSLMTPGRSEAGVPMLQVRKVNTPADLASLRAVISRVFYITPLEVDLILNDGVLGIEAVRHYLGLWGGKPVATATLVLSGDLPGIWNVGTLPEYRRRGISTEIMHRLVSDAHSLGYPATMLLASPDGLPLYRQLGYNTLSTMRMYAPSRQPGYGED